MRYGILDYGVKDQGETAQEALANTLYLVQTAERLGFDRFWVAEHHNVHALTISSPELVMMYLANHTQSIRLGSGGIMALHYSPYKIAEWLRTLEVAYPNRFELGIGNSLGTEAVHQALKSPHTAQDYSQVLSDIRDYLSKSDQGHEGFRTNPITSSLPNIWTLSTGIQTAKIAGELGLSYTYGIFPYIDKNHDRLAQEAIRTYRQYFQSSQIRDCPQVMLAIFVVIAETDDMANQLAKSLDIWSLGKQDFNEFDAFPGWEEVSHYSLTKEERIRVASNRTRMVVGSPQSVKKRIDDLVETTEADDLLFIPLMPKLANRLRAMELLAELYITT